MPVTLYSGGRNFVTTAQFFALWRAVGELSSDPAAGLTIATNLDAASLPPSRVAASHARDYREAGRPDGCGDVPVSGTVR
jgi:hypothetical protein